MESEFWKWLAGGLLVTLTAVVGFFGKRIPKRQDEFDVRLRDAVSTEQLNQTVGALRNEMTRNNESTEKWLTQLCTRVEDQTKAMTDASQIHSRDMQNILQQMLRDKN